MNDTLMEQLADNGSYAYVDDQDEARKLFVENLTSTLQVIALDATPALAGGATPAVLLGDAREIQVDFNPDVVAYYRLIGYKNRDVCRWLWLHHSLDFRKDAGDRRRAQCYRPLRHHVPPQHGWPYRHRSTTRGRS